MMTLCLRFYLIAKIFLICPIGAQITLGIVPGNGIANNGSSRGPPTWDQLVDLAETPINCIHDKMGCGWPKGAYFWYPGGQHNLYNGWGWDPVRINIIVEDTEIIGGNSYTKMVNSETYTNNNYYHEQTTFTVDKSIVLENSVGQSFKEWHWWTVPVNVGLKVCTVKEEKAADCIFSDFASKYNFNLGKTETKNFSQTYESDTTIQVTLDYEDSATVKTYATVGQVQVKITYKAYLDGYYTADYYPKMCKGHFFQGAPASWCQYSSRQYTTAVYNVLYHDDIYWTIENQGMLLLNTSMHENLPEKIEISSLLEQEAL